MPKRGQLSSNASPRSKAQRKYNSKPEQKKNRAARNRVRAQAKAAGQKVAGKDVGHKRPLKNGGSKSKSNTKLQSVKSNRAHGGRIGNKAGKARGGRKSK